VRTDTPSESIHGKIDNTSSCKITSTHLLRYPIRSSLTSLYTDLRWCGFLIRYT